jgi:hypothetical protein
MHRTYCSLFDKNYLPHFLSLHDSLKTNIPYFVIYAFCMDDESYNFLLKSDSKNIIPISCIELENHFTDLKIAKSNRSIIEYYYTCTSAICSFVFDKYDNIDLLTYLDAYLFFFSSPEPIYNELKDASIGIIKHKFDFFSKVLYQKYGKFNVGWVSFKNDTNARNCLEDWRKDCLNWCYSYLDNDRFADQKYLNYWSENYSGVHIINHVGANVAPWNVGRYNISINLISKKIKINDKNLIFFHFSSLNQLDINNYTTSLSLYLTNLSNNIKSFIYLPYLISIQKYNKELGLNVALGDFKTDISYKSIMKKTRNLYIIIRRFIFNDRIKI